MSKNTSHTSMNEIAKHINTSYHASSQDMVTMFSDFQIKKLNSDDMTYTVEKAIHDQV